MYRLRDDACDCVAEELKYKKKKRYLRMLLCKRRRRKYREKPSRGDRNIPYDGVRTNKEYCRRPMDCKKARGGTKLEREAYIRKEIEALKETVERINRTACMPENINDSMLAREELLAKRHGTGSSGVETTVGTVHSTDTKRYGGGADSLNIQRVPSKFSECFKSFRETI